MTKAPSVRERERKSEREREGASHQMAKSHEQSRKVGVSPKEWPRCKGICRKVSGEEGRKEGRKSRADFLLPISMGLMGVAPRQSRSVRVEEEEDRD